MKLPDTIERMMFGFIESQVLFVCDEIGLFDYLDDAGLSECEKISQALNLPIASLERLLICAVSINLLEKNNNKYMIKQTWVPYLTRKSEYYCGGRFSHYWKTSYKIFEFLKPALEENRPQWDKIDNTLSQKDLLNAVYADSIYADPIATKEFLSTMWASGYKDSKDLCKKYSFNGYKRLVDLGGATGSFAIAALQENDLLQAEIMDYPQVKLHAEEKFHEHNLAHRINFHEGNMFTDILPEGDIYAIGYVLSDWPEEVCLSLIRKVYDILPPNGLIVILEKFFNDDKTGPYLTAMLNLTMLLEMYGKHRTTGEYISWLDNAGFSNFQTIYSSGEKHMIVAKKIISR